MKRLGGILWLALLLAAVVAETAIGQTNGSAVAETIWDGVYTNDQADRGEQAAQQKCGSCHSTSEWSDRGFIIGWAGRSIFDLHTHLRMTMPFDAPGTLSAEQYTDIVAYMLKLNNAPAGDRELPSEAAELERIEVTRPASP